MDGIFSNEISNTLQYFTFPLEVIGLTLATIEVRFPNLAAKLNSSLKSSLSKGERERDQGLIRSTLKEESMVKKYGEKRTKWIMYFILGSALCLCVFIAVIYLLRLIEGQASNLQEVASFLVWVFLLPLAYLASHFILRSHRFVVRWVPDRAVGTIGIIIAGFGVLGEAYQFTALMLL